MIDIGKVETVVNSRAIVKLTKNKNCEKCNLCYFTKDNNINVLVNNRIKAKAGDTVEIVSATRDFNTLVKVLNFLPLFMLIIGFFVGFAFKSTLLQFACTLGFFAISMVAMVFLVKYINSRPKIVYIMQKIVPKKKDEEYKEEKVDHKEEIV